MSGMSRACTVCRHPERETIDEMLRKGEALRAIGRRYGRTHRTLGRHKHHLAAGGGTRETTPAATVGGQGAHPVDKKARDANGE